MSAVLGVLGFVFWCYVIYGVCWVIVAVFREAYRKPTAEEMRQYQQERLNELWGIK